MATTAPPTSSIPEFKIVSRLDGVPLVHDGVAGIQSVINSTQLTTSLYQTVEALALKSYDLATPILTRTKPLLEGVDGLAVATFDRAEATFPYAFKTPTDDLIVVKQTKAVYNDRVMPLYQSPAVQQTLESLAKVNSALGARASATIQSSQEIGHNLLEQLRALAESGKDLPAVFVDGVGKLTADVRNIVFAKDKAVQDKTKELGAYILDHVKPMVEELHKQVLGAKAKAEDKAEDAKNTAAATVDEAQDKAAATVDEAQTKAQEVTQ